MNIWGLHSSFIDCESFLEFSWHSCSMWDKPGWCNWFWKFLCERLSSFNPKGFKYSYICMVSQFIWRKDFLLLGTYPWKNLQILTMFLTGFTSLSILLLFPLLITISVFMHGFQFYFIYNRWGSLDPTIC